MLPILLELPFTVSTVLLLNLQQRKRQNANVDVQLYLYIVVLLIQLVMFFTYDVLDSETTLLNVTTAAFLLGTGIYAYTYGQTAALALTEFWRNHSDQRQRETETIRTLTNVGLYLIYAIYAVNLMNGTLPQMFATQFMFDFYSQTGTGLAFIMVAYSLCDYYPMADRLRLEEPSLAF